MESPAGSLGQLGGALEQPRVELIGAEAWQDAISTRLVSCGSNTRCDLMHLPPSTIQTRLQVWHPFYRILSHDFQ